MWAITDFACHADSTTFVASSGDDGRICTVPKGMQPPRQLLLQSMQEGLPLLSSHQTSRGNSTHVQAVGEGVEGCQKYWRIWAFFHWHDKRTARRRRVYFNIAERFSLQDILKGNAHFRTSLTGIALISHLGTEATLQYKGSWLCHLKMSLSRKVVLKVSPKERITGKVLLLLDGS